LSMRCCMGSLSCLPLAPATTSSMRVGWGAPVPHHCAACCCTRPVICGFLNRSATRLHAQCCHVTWVARIHTHAGVNTVVRCSVLVALVSVGASLALDNRLITTAYLTWCTCYLRLLRWPKRHICCSCSTQHCIGGVVLGSPPACWHCCCWLGRRGRVC
jgi:hypothetical protein